MSLSSLLGDALTAFEKTTPEDWGRAIKTGLDDAAAGGGAESDIAEGLKVLLPQYALIITLAQIAIGVAPEMKPAEWNSPVMLDRSDDPYAARPEDSPAAVKTGEVPMNDG
jgi:hypothetical protein